VRYYILIIAVLLFNVVLAIPVDYPVSADRSLNYLAHSIGDINVMNSNMGLFDTIYYPRDSGNLVTYQGAIWISGKRYRRDVLGRKLYWLNYPPTPGNDGVVPSSSIQWNPGLVAVLDTLTSVGNDGDQDLQELLPAYNMLLMSNPEMAAFYDTYNPQDIVLSSLHGIPSPRPFAIPDPLGTYCFTIPQTSVMETPGYETHSAYYYDYCPFGTDGERDYGAYSSVNHHYPLGLAIHQESYAWDLQYFHNFVIYKTTVYNTSTVDTLFDIAVSQYMDNDLYPVSWGSVGASDDKSGYVKGEGYEFAYSRDADYDGGLSPYFVANKLYIPGFTGNRASWYWSVGNGPNDSNPRDLTSTNRTSNEKYWLSTCRNPDPYSFSALRPEPDNVMEYEQPQANDTRFLNTLCGSQPGMIDYQENKLWLVPGANITFYSIVFCGGNLEELKAQSVFATEFINGGLNLGEIEGLTCIPYLRPVTIQYPNTFNLNWFSGNDPHHFEVLYKPYSSPASQWQSIEKPGTARNHSITNLSPTVWYEMKVASIYNPGPNEVYLESETQLVNFQYISPNDDQVLAPGASLTNYPNPFTSNTTVTFELKEPKDMSLAVYNIKGQLVNTLINSPQASGSHSVNWDGRDKNGVPCSSGVYYLRMQSGTQTQVRKVLILK
jgi:hypothetical protein